MDWREHWKVDDRSQRHFVHTLPFPIPHHHLSPKLSLINVCSPDSSEKQRWPEAVRCHPMFRMLVLQALNNLSD